MYKRFLGLLLAGTMMLPSTGFASNREFVKITIGDKPAVEVKEDKVAQWNSTRTIVVREDSKGYYVSEFDINLKTATKLYNELKDNGVAVQLQVAKDKSEDLNAAGRKSNLSNPKLYISIHHNASDSKNAEGYYAITNEGDATGANIAGKLSNSIADNGLVKQRDNANNTGSYIGELNKIHNSTIPVLFELGFFTNPEELYNFIVIKNKYGIIETDWNFILEIQLMFQI